MALDGDLEHRRAHADLVPVAQVHFGQPAAGCLLGTLLPAAAAVLLAVHVGAVETAEIAQAGMRRIHLEQEVMAGGGGVGGGQLGVAVRGAAEEERVVPVVREHAAREGTGGNLERHAISHGRWRIIEDAATCARAASDASHRRPSPPPLLSARGSYRSERTSSMPGKK